MRRRWWIRALLVIYMLPWRLAAVQAFIQFHWIVIGELGLIDRVLSELFGIDGPPGSVTVGSRTGCNIIAYI
jgi:hypothetical protein